MTSPANLIKNQKQSEDKLAKGYLRETLIDILDRHPYGLNCHEIAEKTGWQMNTVTSQLSKARDAGLVMAASEGYYEPTKRTIAVWTVVRGLVSGCNNSQLGHLANFPGQEKKMTRKNALEILKKECWIGGDLFKVTIYPKVEAGQKPCTANDIQRALHVLIN